MPTAVTTLPSLSEQAERLIELGVHRMAGLPVEQLQNVPHRPGSLLVIHPDLVPASALAPLLRINGKPVFVVGALHPMIIRTRVHEIEALQLKMGDRAEVSFESLPGRAFEAKLTALPWTSATPDLEQPTYFDVEFTVANPDLLLKEGLKAQVVLDKNR